MGLSARSGLVLFLALGLAACGDDDGDSGMPDAAAVIDADVTPDAPPLILSDIEVSVDYQGTREGALLVAATKEDPPEGPPLAFRSVDEPAFPETVTLRNLEVGTLYVIAILDVEPASPTIPGPEDLRVASEPIEIDGSEDPSVQLVIEDPDEGE